MLTLIGMTARTSGTQTFMAVYFSAAFAACVVQVRMINCAR
ncbi:MAG: hypothetical protein WCA56_03505 [Xanthobacteraceae bacterium]